MTEIKPAPKKSVALSGVVAGNTALCTVGRSGNDLHYRGYDILDIAESCEFEEIAHLLVHGSLPSSSELRNYKAKLKALRGLPLAVLRTLELLPAAAHPMDVLRSGVSALGCVLPEAHDHNQPGARDIADRLMASLGSMLLYWHHYAHHGRRIELETDDDSIGAHFLHLLHGRKPSASHQRAMHTSLNLYAEHEFNASTFTARVIASTGADVAAALSGAVGALSGPLHGGAPARVLRMLDDVERTGDAERYVREVLDRGERLMGFGHRVYRAEDPRARVLRRTAKAIGSPRAEVAEALEAAALAELLARKPDRVLATNVEFWSAVVLDHADVPPELFTALFTCARTAGWSAHILEQKREGRLIRPTAKYVGESGRSLSVA
jgi:2-methylcitrate synthase